jgi:hypothetical protein
MSLMIDECVSTETAAAGVLVSLSHNPPPAVSMLQGCIRRKNTGGLVGITGTKYGLTVPLAVAYQLPVKLPVRLV